MRLVAIDPSIRSAGVAVFSDGLLVAATAIKMPRDAVGKGLGTRVDAMARAIAEWLDLDAAGCTVVYEWPQVYRAAKSPGDPNDLIALSAVGAAACAFLGAAEIRTPTPAEWAGQLPKVKATASALGSPRALRIRSRLSSAEAQHLTTSHDLIDAVGIGLWALGRLAPARVYPR